MTDQLEPLEARRLLSAGEIDISFGTAGVSDLEFGQRLEYLRYLAAIPGGKTLALGAIGDQQTLAAARFNTDGSLDTSFAASGKLTTTLKADFDGPATVAVDSSSGRFAVITSRPANADAISGIAVFNADGTPDTSFGGGDGLVEEGEIADFTSLARIAFAPGGKLLVAGYVPPQGERTRSVVTLRRLNVNGTPDTAFGDAGVRTFDAIDGAQDLVVMPDGRIILATSYYHVLPIERGGDTFGGQHIYRLTVDGDLDATFGNGGAVGFGQIVSDVGPSQTLVLDVDVRPDGTLYVLSYEDGRVLRRITSTGVIDGNFVDALSSSPRYTRLGVDAGGFVLVADDAGNVARLMPAGQLDKSYGTNGVATVSDGRTALVNPADGSVIVGGVHNPSKARGYDWRLTKLQGGAGRTPPATLNLRGTLLYNALDSDDTIQLTIRRLDGRLVLRNGDFAQSFATSRVKRIAIFAAGGDDTVTIGPGVRGAYVDGGDGADTLNGGQGGDVLLGGLNGDQIFGNDGDDSILGGGGNDYCLGGAGKDELFGNGGVDTLSGAGGNDRLFGGPGDADHVRGGAGTDAAADDEKDSYDSVETLLA
jgi:uncharacterized delta-60 repeat protein